MPGPEQAAFWRLAAFHGYFTMDAAITVAAHEAITADQVVTSVANLVDKPLVATDISGAEPTIAFSKWRVHMHSTSSRKAVNTTG